MIKIIINSKIFLYYFDFAYRAEKIPNQYKKSYTLYIDFSVKDTKSKILNQIYIEAFENFRA